MILVTGGARSGKSTFGENLLRDMDNVLYIATSVPFDDEMRERVNHHKNSRNQNWNTLECYRDFSKYINNIEAYNGIIVDCITIMVTNILLEYMEKKPNEKIENAEKFIIDEVKSLITILKKFSGKAVIVTNEVGYGIVPENKLSRVFRDIAGRVNQYIAKECSEVYLVVCSYPLRVK